MKYIQYQQTPYAPLQKAKESVDDAVLNFRNDFRKLPGVRQIYGALDKNKPSNGTIEQHLNEGEYVFTDPETGEKSLVQAEIGYAPAVGVSSTPSAATAVRRGRPVGAMTPEAKAKFLAKRAATLAQKLKDSAESMFIKPNQQLYITTAKTMGGPVPRGVKPTLEYNTLEEMAAAAKANRTKAVADNSREVAVGIQKSIDNAAGHNTAMRVSDGIAMRKQAIKESNKLKLQGPTGTSLSGANYYGTLSMKPNITGMNPEYIRKTAAKNGYQSFKYTNFDGAYQALSKTLKQTFSGSEAEFNEMIQRVFPEILKLEKNGGTLNYLNYFK